MNNRFLLFCINLVFLTLFHSCERKETEIPNNSPSMELKVLMIGSSFSINTFLQFPALATAADIDFVGGILYQGAINLHQISEIIDEDGDFAVSRIYTSITNKWEKAPKNLKEMLNLYDWDIIILARCAPNIIGGSDQWSELMSNDLNKIIEYLHSTLSREFEIMFNSSFSRSVAYFNYSREAQLESVMQIMETSKIIQNEYKIDIIPSAIAIQNARNTDLCYVETINSNHYLIPDLTGIGDHLDTGVGSYILGCLLFEHILGKRFGLSVLNLHTIPKLENVTNNGVFNDSCYTQISPEQAEIAKYSAVCAAQGIWIERDFVIDTTLEQTH